MSKAVLISIRPEWCAKIANGEKTIEIRKTRPKLETPFKCYIYCTNTGRPLVWGDVACAGGWRECYTQTYGRSREEVDRIWGSDVLSGKVIGEFACDRIDVYRRIGIDSTDFKDYHYRKSLFGEVEYNEMCLTENELKMYGKGKLLYGWHISNLVIYDTPKSLTDYMKHPCDFAADCGACERAKWSKGQTFEGCEFDVQRPPQSFIYVEELP